MHQILAVCMNPCQNFEYTVSYAAQSLSLEMLNISHEDAKNIFVEHQFAAEKLSEFYFWKTFFDNESMEINTNI